MPEKKIGFLGFGNMAAAMAEGLIRGGTPPGNILASAAHWEKLESTAGAMGVRPCRSNEELVRESDITVAAVKPYLMEQALTPLLPLLKGKVLVTVASGWGFARLEALTGPEIRHVSCMPNTPVAVGEGVVLFEEETTLTSEETEELCALFAPLGTVLTLPGHQMDAAGKISGCGPAFAALFLEALGDAGVYHGLPRALAYRVAAQMLAGTGKLHLETGEHPGAMKDAVCSPNGTTIAGVEALEEKGFRAAVIAAIHAAHSRS